MIRLFEIENNKPKATEHCHMISWLKAIIEKYPEPEVHVNALAYCFYMTCPSQENPFYNTPDHELEDVVEKEIDINFDTEDDVIQTALEKLEELYTTPTVRAYKGIKQMLDNLSEYMATTKITHGKNGNITSLVQAIFPFLP